MRIKKNLLQYKRDTYIKDNENNNNDDKLTRIDCSFGNNPFYNANKIKYGLAEISINQISLYQEFSEINKLKDLILEKYKDTKLSRNNIFLGHGSFNIMERIIHKLINAEKMIGVGPQFNEIPSEFISASGYYNAISLIDNGFKLDTLIKSLHDNLYDILYLDNPNNPTGFTFKQSDLIKLATICEKKGTIFLIDEAFADFIDDELSSIHLVNKFNNIIVVRSFSKGFGLSAIRSGYMVTSDKIAKIYKEIDVPFEPSYISLRISILALQDDEFIKYSRENTIKVKEYLINGLKRYNIDILPSNPKVPIFMAHKKNIDLYNSLLLLNIITEPGESFSNTCELLDNSYVRIRIPSSISEAKEFIHRLK